MKRFLVIFSIISCSAAGLAGCGGGGGGASAPTVATTKMYLFGTMSSASAGGSAGIMDSINTTISTLPAGVTLTSIVPSGIALGIPPGDATTGFNGGTRDLTISLLNSNHTQVIASNVGNGVEVATLSFALTGGATPPIPTPGTAATVFQYRTGPLSIKNLNGCTINFTTTYQ